MYRAALVLLFLSFAPMPEAMAQEATWHVGPPGNEPLDAIYRHADGDIDGDGIDEIAVYCSTTFFTITDNSWPGVTGRVPAILMVDDRSYEVTAEHLTDAGPYTVMAMPYIRNAVWMSWSAEDAPDFSTATRVRVVIGGDVRDYGEGAGAALQIVREQCVRNVRGPPYN